MLESLTSDQSTVTHDESTTNTRTLARARGTGTSRQQAYVPTYCLGHKRSTPTWEDRQAELWVQNELLRMYLAEAQWQEQR